MQVCTWLSNNAFSCVTWLQSLVENGSESCQRSSPNFWAPPSEVAVLFDSESCGALCYFACQEKHSSASGTVAAVWQVLQGKPKFELFLLSTDHNDFIVMILTGNQVIDGDQQWGLIHQAECRHCLNCWLIIVILVSPALDLQCKLNVQTLDNTWVVHV